MSRKHSRISEWVRPFEGRNQNAYVVAFVDFFNRQKFYEAHEILEILWLPARKTRDDAFYKGLIQLAGAFVHLQKNRLQPALALLRLAKVNLSSFADARHGIKIVGVLKLIENWEARVRNGDTETPQINSTTAPILLVEADIPGDR